MLRLLPQLLLCSLAQRGARIDECRMSSLSHATNVLAAAADKKVHYVSQVLIVRVTSSLYCATACTANSRPFTKTACLHLAPPALASVISTA